jgi:hypothetical protein
MLINKIIGGFIIQTFDTDLGTVVNQEFVPSDYCVYEPEDVHKMCRNFVKPEEYLAIEISDENKIIVKELI